MGETANDIKKREIRLIKIAQRELGIDEETYRSMLWAIARVRSASDLDWTGRKKVLEHMKKSGFKVKRTPNNPNANDATYRKVRQLWSEMHRAGIIEHDTDQAVNAYVKRLTRVDDFRFLNSHQVATIIESLKRWQGRFSRGETNVDSEDMVKQQEKKSIRGNHG
ncbi:MAG: hypothetical protein GAK35_02322 [Herbaspirillum frisingense]|uniref:Regulatory protein GemA n=1 Tax=Herbaspirillum frisingense TaxID=92645 RepID=A0A7V8JUC3_9BURK|nr:MAG: hypothetical protein GAK35_02322 [Herbaspirillum frisingense]